MTPEWRSYLIINGLQWLLVALIGTVVHLQLGVSRMVVVVVVLAWIGQDLAACTSQQLPMTSRDRPAP